MPNPYENAMRMAINAAEKYLGATAPHAPLGLIALDRANKVLLGTAQQSPREPSAEAKLFDLAGKLGKLAAIETLVCTLEPSEKMAQEILRHKKIRRVVVGAQAQNSGTEKLRQGKIEIMEGLLEEECEFLTRAFQKFARAKRPYVTLLAAANPKGEIIPWKNVQSKASLIFAHEVRKRADAAWIGSGSALASPPTLRVNWVPDHPQKKRLLVASDRRRRIPASWFAEARKENFSEPFFAESFPAGLDFLGSKGILEVVVDAGATLREAWLESDLWDESVVILQGEGDADDEIDVQFREEAGAD